MSYQQSFSYKGMGLPGLNQYLAMRLEPGAPQFRVKHSTTEPLPFLWQAFVAYNG